MQMDHCHENGTEQIIHLKQWRSKQDLKKQENEFSALYINYEFHQLIAESYDLIDRMKHKELDVVLVICSKCLIQELKKRCADNGQIYISSITKMQVTLEKKLQKIYSGL